MSSGVCGIWAMKAGDFVAREYAGTTAGLAQAVIDMGSNGVITVYPGNSSITIPSSVDKGIRIIFNEAGQQKHYGIDGTRIDRQKNVRTFGAKGDGIADDTAAFVAAHADLDANGGEIYLPAGDYLISSKMTFTKRVHIVGSGTHEPDPTSTAPCRIIKKNTGVSYTAMELQGDGSSMENLTVHGEAGNAGDGVVASCQRFSAYNVAIEQMGGTGLFVGTGTNDGNVWTLVHVHSAHNGGDGANIGSDDGFGGPGTNSGQAVCLSCQSNGGAGIRLSEGSKNVFTACHAEACGLAGFIIEGNSDLNTIIGGDFEGNDTIAGGALDQRVDFRIAGPSTGDNMLINVGASGLIVRAASGKVDDTGLNDRTIIISTTHFGLPQGQSVGEMEIMGDGPTGGSITGSNAKYIGLWADFKRRIKIGWKTNGPTTGDVDGGQILYEPGAQTMHVTPRDGASSKVKLSSGSGLADYLLLDSANDKVETTENVKLVPTSNTKGFVEIGELSSDPANGPANTCRIFAKDNGSGKTQLFVRFGSGAIQGPLATEP